MFLAPGVVLGGALAGILATSVATPQKQELKWTACEQEWIKDPTGACASFEVPLDYQNPKTGSATLAIAKIPAKGKKLGTIFVNSGTGIRFLNGHSAGHLYNTTEQSFDIISWDPRGTGHSSPSINCFPTLSNGLSGASLFSEGLTNNASLIVKSTGPTEQDIENFVAKSNLTEATMKRFIQGCTDRNPDVLQYLGTAATARDLISLADAVQGEGHKINYYGLSYGTIIGVHLMQMFPKRLDKIVLDGVVDSIAYSMRPSYLSYASSVRDADKAYDTYYKECAKAGPSDGHGGEGCALASEGSTAEDVKKRMNKLIDDVYNVSQKNLTFSVLSFQSLLRGIASGPEHWHDISTLLKSTENEIQTLLVGGSPRNGSHNLRLRARKLHEGLAKRQYEGSSIIDKALSSSTAIECGDAAELRNVTTRSVFQETVRVTRDVSSIFGPSLTVYPYSYCHLWPVRAVERVAIASKFDIPGSAIIIGNTIDAVTPLGDAQKLYRKINAGKSKRFVQHDAVGHSSLKFRSLCTERIVTNYFKGGELPAGDTICGLNDVPTFVPPHLDHRNLTSHHLIAKPVESGEKPAATQTHSHSFAATYAQIVFDRALSVLDGLTSGSVHHFL